MIVDVVQFSRVTGSLRTVDANRAIVVVNPHRRQIILLVPALWQHSKPPCARPVAFHSGWRRCLVVLPGTSNEWQTDLLPTGVRRISLSARGYTCMQHSKPHVGQRESGKSALATAQAVVCGLLVLREAEQQATLSHSGVADHPARDEVPR